MGVDVATFSNVVITASDQTKSAWDSIRSEASRTASTINSRMASINSAFAAFGVTLGAGAFAAMMKSTIDALDHVNDLTKSTGLLAGEIAGLQLLAKQSGTDVDGLAGSINKLSMNIGKSPEKFQALGISAKDPLQAFKQLADIFVAIEDPQLRAALGAATLGKQWTSAAPALAEGGKRIGEIVEQGQRLSGITPELTRQADQFNDKLVLLTGTNSIMNGLVGQLLPLLNKLAGDMVEAKGKSSGMNDGFTILLDTFKLAVILGGMVAKTFQAIGTAAGAQAAQLAAFAQGDFAGGMLIRKEALADLEKMPGEFLKWRDSILAVGTAAQVAAANVGYISDAEQIAAKRISDAAAKRARALIDAADTTKKAITEYERVIKAADKFVDGLKKETEQLEFTTIQKKMLDAATIALTLKTEKERMVVMSAAQAWALAALAVDAKKEAEKRATEVTAAYLKELENLAAQEEEMAAYVAATNKTRDDAILATQKLIEGIQFETAALKMSNEERELAIAVRAMEAAGVDVQSDSVQNLINRLRSEIAVRNLVKKSIEDQTKAIELQKRAGQDMAKQWATDFRDLGASLTNVFGESGAAAARMLQSIGAGMQRQAQNDADYAAQREALSSRQFATESEYETELATLRQRNADANLQASMGMYGDMAGAAAGFFEKNSQGYNTLMGIAKVFHAAELAMQMAEMVPRAINAILNQGKGDPYSAFARMAAMGALVASLGIAVGGMTGGGGAGSGGTAAEAQKVQGSGTVVGDAAAKSNSLLASLQEIERTDKLGLIYTHGMLEALRAIQNSMANLAALIYRTTGLTTGEGFGDLGLGNVKNNVDPLIGMSGSIGLGFIDDLAQGIAGALGLGGLLDGLLGLWGGVEKEIINSGIAITGSIRDLRQGLGMSSFATVRTTETSWFGLDKDEHDDRVPGQLPENIRLQFSLLFGQIADTVEAAAKALGMWFPGMADAINNFVVDIGDISLQDLKGDELQKALNDIFSTAADKLAMAVFPIAAFEKYIRVGEGFFQTMMRVATENEVAKQAFQALGWTMELTGLAAIQARVDMVELAGGAEEFSKTVNDYYAKFYSPAEQRAFTGQTLQAEFDDAGLSMPTTIAGFRAMVDAIGTATPETRALTLRMMELGPTFYDFATQVIGLDGKLHTLDETTRQHMELEDELAILNGTKTAEFVERTRRMAEAIDATSQATLTAIFVEQDRQAGLEKQKAQNQARWDLEQELLDLTQSESEALERHRSLRMTELSLREAELGLAPGTLQAIQRQIDAQTDLNAARAAEAAAMKATSDLEGRLDVLRGMLTQKEIDRAREWQAAANDTQRVLLTEIYRQEDLAEAAEKAAAALDDLYSSAGINLPNLAAAIKDGLLGNKTGDELGAAMVEMIVGGVYNALANNTAQMITDMINTTLIQPIMTAILNGTSVTAAINATLTQANIDAMIVSATAAVDALAEIFENPAFKAAMESFKTAILGVANTVAAATAGIQNSSSGVFSAGQGLPGQVWISTGGNFGYWAYPPGYVAPTTPGAVADVTEQRLALLASIYELTGDAAGAAAVLVQQHAIALAALDPSLRALQTQLWGLQAAAAAAAKAAEFAKSKRELEIELQRALGNDAIALEMERADLIAGLTAQWGDQAAELIAIYQQIWAAQDAVVSSGGEWVKTLQDWLRNMQLDSNLSPLTARQRFATAEAQYMQDYLLATVGDQDARNRYTSDADAYLREALAMYGRASSEYQAIWNATMLQTQGLIDQGLGPVAPATIADVNGTLQATQDAARQQAAALLDEVRALRAEVRDLKTEAQTGNQLLEEQTDTLESATDRLPRETARELENLTGGIGRAS